MAPELRRHVCAVLVLFTGWLLPFATWVDPRLGLLTLIALGWLLRWWWRLTGRRRPAG